MVKVDRTPTPPPSLAVEKSKASGSYCCDDVVQQLTIDFNNKCYICEFKPSDVEVEHLRPHHGGIERELKYDWNNLFLSCRHCNNLKNNIKYDGNIIDCTTDDPETHISFKLTENDVNIKELDNDFKSLRTAELIYEVFNKKNTGIRIYASSYRLQKLREEMIILYKLLNKYINDKKSTSLNKRIEATLDRSSTFAAFKRGYIRSHINDYPELEKYVNVY